jgi:hypothetical protein
MVLPLAFGIAWSDWNFDTIQPDDALQLLLKNWWMVAWVVVALTLIMIAAVAVHAFVQAGSVGIYLDGERLAGPGQPARAAYRAFAPDRWWAYGRRFWWPVFLIYNIAWGLLGLILIVPMVALLAAVLIVGDSPVLAIIGCAGVVVIFGLLLFGGLLVTVWSDLGIAESVRSGANAREALRSGARILRRYFSDVVIILAVLIAITIAVTFAALSVYFVIGLGSSIPGVAVLFIPAQIALSFAQNAVSVFLAAWFIAAFTGLAFKAHGASDAR